MKFQPAQRFLICVTFAVSLFGALPAFADDFPGKGDRQVWLKACHLCNQASQQFEAGSYDNAFKSFEQAIQMYPYDYVLFYDAGVAHQQHASQASAAKSSDLSGAEYYFRKATELKPDTGTIWISLADVQAKQEKYEEAAKSLQTALNLPTLSASDKQAALQIIHSVKEKVAAPPATADGSAVPATRSDSAIAPVSSTDSAAAPSAGATNFSSTFRTAAGTTNSPSSYSNTISTTSSSVTTPVATTSVTNSASSSPAAGWQSYSGGSCTMQYPNGWQIGGDPRNGRIDLNNANGVRLSVLPFSTSEEIKSSEAAKFFKAMVQYCSPNQPWSKPQRFAENAYRSTFSNDSETSIIAMVFSTSSQGTFGRVAVARVPKGATFPTDTFAQIMSSQRFTAATGAQQAMRQPNMQGAQQPAMQQAMMQQRMMPGMQSPAMMQQRMMPGMQSPGMMQQGMGGAGYLASTPFAGWTTFRDPQEGSFTVAVPIGWKTEGGLTRGSAIDARPWVRTTSPDQLMVAFIGDGKIPPFSMPTSQGAFLGYGVGASYGGGKVEPYMPARKFVEYYAKSNLKGYITDFQVVEANNHPEIAAAINGTVGCSRSEAATIKFTGIIKNIPAVGYYLAVTKATIGYGAGMWWVTQVAGAISPADRDKASLSIIMHMFQTFQLDPQWRGQSLKTTGQVSRDYTRASQAVSQGIVDRYWSQQAANDASNNAYWNQQAVQDHAANNFSDYIRGQQNVQDPDTGTQYKVQYGPEGHYIDPSGNVMGSNYGAPGPEWRQLMAVP